MMIQGMIELADQIKAMRDEGIEHHLILDEVTGRLTEMAGHAMAQKITDLRGGIWVLVSVDEVNRGKGTFDATLDVGPLIEDDETIKILLQKAADAL